MSRRSSVDLALLAPLLGALLACYQREDPPSDWVDRGGAAGRGGVAPTIVNVQVPDWPPLGRDAIVSATVAANASDRLAGVEFGFRHRVASQPSSSATTAIYTVSGQALGEGYGTLEVMAHARSGAFTTRSFPSVLVDLTAPVVELVTVAVARRPGAKLEFWAADAWVLGSVTVDIGGVRRRHAFEAGWPETLGREWDASLVSFDASDFPETTTPGSVVVEDAAGNVARLTLPQGLIDGTPPWLELIAPSDGSAVDDRFVLELASEDQNPGTIEVRLDGTLVAELDGATPRATLDVALLPPGRFTLEATAVDAAGNRSAPQSLSLERRARP